MEVKATKALYVGSFDPFTRGHLDIVRRALDIFDYVTIGVGDNPAKKYMFTREERIALIQDTLRTDGIVDLPVEPVDGLTIDHAKLHGFSHLVKGARTAQDFDYERLLHEISLTQQLGIETVLLFADPKLNNVSSSAAKELCRHQGLTHDFVSLNVKAAIEKKLGQTIIGVTGTIGSGKSTLSKRLASRFENAHYVNLDVIAHEALESQTNLCKAMRFQIVKAFGTIDRKKLGQIVFGDPKALARLNDIYREPLLTLLRLDLAKRRGIIFLEGALLAELGWLHVCSNRVVVVQEPPVPIHAQRLAARGMTPEQIETRLASQYSFARKCEVIDEAIERDGYGKLIVHQSDNTGSQEDSTVAAIKAALL